MIFKEFYYKLFNIALSAIAVFILCGCAVKKEFAENSNELTNVKNDSTRTETINVDSTTILHYKNLKQKESTEKERYVEKSDSTVITIDENGNVKQKEVWHKEREKINQNREYEKTLEDSLSYFRNVVDSLYLYKSICNSLSQNISHNEKEVVEKNTIPKILLVPLFIIGIFIFFLIVKALK